MIEVTTSKQWGWCASCAGLIVRESRDRIWCHANRNCMNLVHVPLNTAEGSDRDMSVKEPIIFSEDVK